MRPNRALWFCLGTAGELIKLYPLMELAQRQGRPWFAVSTGQSAINLKKQWADFGLPADRLFVALSTDRDLASSADALKWFSRAMATGASTLRAKLSEGGRPSSKQDAWIVHGDTLSTLVGSSWGRRLGLEVAHVEAGLRSPKILEPFPEEISRRMVSRLARVHFPQDSKAEQNLKKARVRGQVIPTAANTLLDALRLVLKGAPPQAKGYVVANLHRFENLSSDSRWSVLVDVLVRAAKKSGTVHFVLHPHTQAKLESDPVARARLETAGVKPVPRMMFSQFIPLLNGADYVLSDGGSNQEECHYLGKPCLLLRDSTERQEGLDGSCLLSRFDPVKIDRFLDDPSRFRRAPLSDDIRPSQTILDTLLGESKSGGRDV